MNIDPENIKPPLRIKRKRRDKLNCPFCNEKLEKAASGGRRKRSCSNCKATVDRETHSTCCSKAEVWIQSGKRKCCTCGKGV
jgi:hypothetical protein